MAINQSYTFLLFLIDGLIIGFMFDIFRILRLSFKTSNLLTYIEDLFFWIITGIIIIYTIYIFCDGIIRIYMFLGILIGVLLYILTISKYIVNSSVKAILFIKKVLFKILKPLIWIKNFLKKLFIKTSHFLSIKYKKIHIKSKKFNILQNNTKNIKK